MLVLSEHRKEVRSLVFSPGGDYLASASADRTVRLWDRRTGEVTTTLRGHRTYAHSVTFAQHGKTLACAAGELYLWHLGSGRAAVAEEAGRLLAGHVAFSPDGTMIATAGRTQGGGGSWMGGDARLWDVRGLAAALEEKGQGPARKADRLPIPPLPELSGPLQAGVAPRRPEFHEPDPHHVWVVAFAPEGGLLALGTAGMGVLLWDVAGCQLRRRLSTKAAVRSVSFSADGRLVAAAEATRAQVWEVESGRAVATLKGHKRAVECVAFSPGSATLLTGSEDGTVRVWDAVSGRERAAFSWPTDKVRSVAFAPDGMTAAAAGQNGQIVLWDIDDG